MQEIENIYGEFNFAQTVEEKRKILQHLISEFQISDDEAHELQSQINDFIDNSKIEEDINLSQEIEDGKYQLYTCLKSIGDYKSGSEYYVKVDDPKEFYLSTGIGETNTEIQNMINSIKPNYFIVIDDGIGTLRRKNIFPKDIDFSEYFTKFAL